MKKILLLLFSFSSCLLMGQNIQSISPSSGMQGQSLTVSITGQNTIFQQGTNVIKLVQGSTVISPTSATFISNTLINATFAFNIDHPTGLYDVVIYGYLTTSTLTLPNSFTLNANPNPPSLSSISPAIAYQGDTVMTTIHGINTNFNSGVNTIWINNGTYNLYATTVTVINNTTAEAKFIFYNVSSVGDYTLHVSNSLDGTMLLNNAFHLNTGANPASIKSISPSSGMQGQTLTVSITGQNTAFQQGTNIIKLVQGGNVIDFTSANSVSNTLIDAIFTFNYSQPLGVYDVIVGDNSTTLILTLPNSFTLNANPNPPKLVSINPNNGVQGQTLTVSITGQNTTFQQGTNVIKLIQGSTVISPTSVTFISNTLMNATFAFNYNQPLGLYDVVVDNYLTTSTLTLPNSFTLIANPNPPKLVSVNPNNAVQGQTLTVSITGQNTTFQQGTNVIKLIQGSTVISPTSVMFISNTLINATFAFNYNQPLGLYDVVVDNYLTTSTLTLPNGFTLKANPNPPKLVSVSPNNAIQGQTLTISITGQNMVFMQASNTIHLIRGSTSITPTSSTYINDTLIQADFTFTGNHPEGIYSVTVNNYSLSNAFTINSKLASISPASATQGDTVIITITGANTHFGSAPDSVWLKNIYGHVIVPASVTVINSVTLKAKFIFTNSHLAEIYSVYVTNSMDGLSQISNAFTLKPGTNSPMILKVTPQYAWVDYVPVNINITGKYTHFQQGLTTIRLANETTSVYPKSINIINDTLINADFTFPSQCIGHPMFLDVLIEGSENIVLKNGFYINYVVDVVELGNTETINVFPNPSTGLLNIVLNESIKDAELSIADIQGRSIYHQDKILTPSIQVDISAYQKGIYFINVKNPTKSIVKKVVLIESNK